MDEVLKWVEARLHDIGREGAVLTQVRDRLRDELGQGQGDGWAQVGSRGDE